MSFRAFLNPRSSGKARAGGLQSGGPDGRASLSMSLLTCLITAGASQGATAGSIPETFLFSRCSTVAEALPDLVIGANGHQTVTASYGRSLITIDDPGMDGLVCERGCGLSISTAEDAPKRYELASRKVALASDQTFRIKGGTAIYRSLALKIEGDRWLLLGVGYLMRGDGSRSYRVFDAEVIDRPGSPTKSSTNMKVASCLERP
jgi:hypothetical protein